MYFYFSFIMCYINLCRGNMNYECLPHIFILLLDIGIAKYFVFVDCFKLFVYTNMTNY